MKSGTGIALDATNGGCAAVAVPGGGSVGEDSERGLLSKFPVDKDGCTPGFFSLVLDDAGGPASPPTGDPGMMSGTDL